MSDSMTTPLLLSANQSATLCGTSVRTWRTWDAGGLVPRPILIGRSKFWRATELVEWVESDCPRRDQWELRGDFQS